MLLTFIFLAMALITFSTIYFSQQNNQSFFNPDKVKLILNDHDYLLSTTAGILPRVPWDLLISGNSPFSVDYLRTAKQLNVNFKDRVFAHQYLNSFKVTV